MPISRVNKRTFGIAVFLLILTTVIASLLLLPAEPKFHGKSFSQWMDQLPSIDIGVNGRSEGIRLPGWYQTSVAAVADQGRVSSNITQACKALDIIGTNHLSLLVARLQVADSRVMTTVWDWAERMRLIRDAEIHLAHFRRGQALHAFSYLGNRARPVVPQLLELTTNQNPTIQLLAWSALERVAPDEFHQRKHPPIIQHAPR